MIYTESLIYDYVRKLYRLVRENSQLTREMLENLKHRYPFEYLGEVETPKMPSKELKKTVERCLHTLDDMAVEHSVGYIRAKEILDKMLEDIKRAEGLKEEYDFPEGPMSFEYREGPPGQVRIVLPEHAPRLEVKWGSWPGHTNIVSVKKRWKALVHRAVKTAEKMPLEPFSRAVCLVIHCVPSWLHVVDPDNYAAKYTIDALQEVGLLQNDSSEHLILVQIAKKDSPTRTEINLFELEEMHHPGKSIDELAELYCHYLANPGT